MIFSELNAFFDLIRKIFLFKTKPIPPKTSVAGRFFTLFEQHGITSSQIPRFFDHGLTIADTKDEDTLYLKLTEDILNDACDLFAVRREWLDGADSQIYKIHRFYKQPEEFDKFLDEMLKFKRSSELTGKVISGHSSESSTMAIMYLEENIGWLGDKPIYRFHLCDEWILSYWKSRAYLTACVSMAWKRDVYIHGRVVSKPNLDSFIQGESFIIDSQAWENNTLERSFQGRHWYPEDMAVKPEAFLQGLDPERDNFGIKAGLTLWLELAEKGLMETDLSYENVKENFQLELMRINN